MKGIIQPDHIPVNKFTLIVAGLAVQITPTEISGAEEAIDTTVLPDRTEATGGEAQPSEVTVMVPAHHTAQIAAMEVWFAEGKNPVSPTYKKSAVLVMPSLTGENFRFRSWIGVHISARKDPDLELANEGEMAAIEYTLKINQILPG